MSDGVKSWLVDQKEQRAVMFLRSKGRCPADAAEFVKWIMEFEEFNLETIRIILKSLED